MSDLAAPLILSLEIAGWATALVGVVGIPLAFVLARRRFWGKSLVEALITVPLVLPPTVVGYLIIVSLGTRSWIGGYLKRHFDYRLLFTKEGAVLAAATVALPLAYIPAKAAFESVERDLEDTARLYGAGAWTVFWQVSVPMARRGIFSGLLLAFARALGEFGATAMVFGWQSGRVTLPIAIFSDYTNGEMGHAAWAAALLGGASLSVILLYNATVDRTRD